MAINIKKLAISGSIAGAGTSILLMYFIMPVLNFVGQYVPAFSLKLANEGVAINIRESLTGIQGGLAGWLMNMFGITVPESLIMNIVVSAVGGVIFFVAGGYLADALGLLKGNAVKKTAITIFAGSLIAASILGTIGLPPELNLSSVNVLVAFGINAAVLAWLYGLIDSKAEIGLIPY